MRVRLLGHAGGQSAARGRAAAHPGQFEPGDDNDRSGPGGSHLYRADDAGGADEDHRARTARRDPADGRRADRAEPGDRACRGGRARSIQVRTYRGEARGDQEGRGSRPVQAGDAENRARGAALRHRAFGGRRRAGAGRAWPAGDHPAVANAGRNRRLDRARTRRLSRQGGVRTRTIAEPRSADRAIGRRVEGIRARGDARHGGQRRDHLLDRESGSDGRAHGRFDNGRSRADADRQGIPDHARRGDSHHPRNRRRYRRIEHPVCDRTGDRTDGRDRDEPARVAQFGAGVEGDRISNRQDRGAAGSRLPARRDSQRHHAHDAVVLRADDRLRGHQDSALHVREVSRRGRRAGTADEVGRRGDGDRADLQGVAAEGATLARNRIARAGKRAPRATERSCGGADPRSSRDREQPSFVPSGGRFTAGHIAGGSLPAEQNRSVVYRRGRGAGGGGKARRARAARRSIFPGVQADGIFRSANRGAARNR